MEAPTIDDLQARGWERTADGRLWHPILQRHQPVPKGEVDRSKRLRESLLSDISEFFDTLIDGGKIGLTADDEGQLAAARIALTKIPAVIVKAIIRSGGRLHIAKATNINGYLGLTRDRRATVAGDREGADATLLHELAHLADCVKGHYWLSYGEDFMRLWGKDWFAGTIPAGCGQQEDPREYFAESAASYWYSEATRKRLPPAVQAYMQALPTRFM
jgi:hypothetical protein